MKKQSQNKPNFRKAKMNENLSATKDYENETNLRFEQIKPKQTQSFDPSTVLRASSLSLRTGFRRDEGFSGCAASGTVSS